eukprot:5271385-Prymnesium_polylepis.1
MPCRAELDCSSLEVWSAEPEGVPVRKIGPVNHSRALASRNIIRTARDRQGHDSSLETRCANAPHRSGEMDRFEIRRPGGGALEVEPPRDRTDRNSCGCAPPCAGQGRLRSAVRCSASPRHLRAKTGTTPLCGRTVALMLLLFSYSLSLRFESAVSSLSLATGQGQREGPPASVSRILSKLANGGAAHEAVKCSNAPPALGDREKAGASRTPTLFADPPWFDLPQQSGQVLNVHGIKPQRELRIWQQILVGLLNQWLDDDRHAKHRERQIRAPTVPPATVRAT